MSGSPEKNKEKMKMSDLRIPDLNRITVAGRLTRDPELRYTPSGKAVCKFSVAHSRRWRNAQGEQQEAATFLDCAAWDKLAESIAERLRKGRPVIVEGEIQQENWTDKTTQRPRSTRVIRVSRCHEIDWASKDAPPAQAATRTEEPQPEQDDIPF